VNTVPLAFEFLDSARTIIFERSGHSTVSEEFSLSSESGRQSSNGQPRRHRVHARQPHKPGCRIVFI